MWIARPTSKQRLNMASWYKPHCMTMDGYRTYNCPGGQHLGVVGRRYVLRYRWRAKWQMLIDQLICWWKHTGSLARRSGHLSEISLPVFFHDVMPPADAARWVCRRTTVIRVILCRHLGVMLEMIFLDVAYSMWNYVLVLRLRSYSFTQFQWSLENAAADLTYRLHGVRNKRGVH